jgi:uncharacterized short protein YbdD (DUF466 family)
MKKDSELQSCELPADGRQRPASGYELVRIARRARAVVERVLGVPDYEAYVTHVREAHPDARALAREEFINRRLTERYSKPGARCC